MQFRSLILLLMLALLAWANPAHAARSYDNCTGFVTALPAVISTPGTWCLNQNLTTSITSGKAILIAANDVVLDCNDFRIDGLSAGAGTTTWGIVAMSQTHETVRHCNVRGFFRGLYFPATTGGGRHIVENNVFNNNTWNAIDLEGADSVIRRNRIFDTGGTTVSSAATEAVAIVVAYSVDVIGNTISGVMPLSGTNGSPIGISLTSETTANISGNNIHGLVPTGTGTPNGIVFNGASARVSVRDNILASTGAVGSQGIYCLNVSTIRPKDNVIHGFTNGLFECTDAGGNDISP
jgi:hypothetical protein